jgi:hypothetical protein
MFKMNRLTRRILLVCLLLVSLSLLAACQSPEETEPTPEPTEVADSSTVQEEEEPTAEPAPTDTQTPLPTDTATPEPTDTPAPTDTPQPTATATRPRPTATATRPRPTETAAPDADDSDDSGENTGELDALRLVIEAETAARELRTITMMQNVNVNFQIVEQTSIQTCYIELPDHTYCVTDSIVSFGSTEPVTTTNEVVQIGEQVWIREGVDGEWQELPEDALGAAGLSEEGLGQLRLSDYMTEVELVGETTIDGVPVHEVTFGLDVPAYFSSVLGEEAAEQFLASAGDSSGSGTMWIGQEDNLTRKALVEMMIEVEGQEMVMTTQVTYTAFNEPVEIPDPTAE